MNSIAPAFDAIEPFLDPLALAIVCIGTLVALIVRTPSRDLLRAGAAVFVLARRPWRADRTIEQIGALARIARKHGIVSLNRSVIRDRDVADAVTDIIDGAGPDTLERMLGERALARSERHLAAAEVWASIAEIAPAMGMIGTLIGLVRMFMVMTDPSQIGGAMAVALLTTLYGAVIATLIASPIAGRLRRLARSEAVERLRLEAPLLALALREQPAFRRVAA